MTNFNPNGNNWANSDNMGKKLLEKAGWSKGEGVGKNKQGTKVHIKVSVKNEKDGIGLKSEKRENDLSLNQCFQFDNLLKSKYCQQKETCDEENVMERGLSRSRYGRAVPKEFFKPVSNDAWNKILCKNKVDETSVENNDTTVQEASTGESTDSFNFKSNYTIYEYFSLKMQKKARNSECGDFKYDTFVINKMDSLHSFIKHQVDEQADDGAGPLTGKKNHKRVADGDDAESAVAECVAEKRRKSNDIDADLDGAKKKKSKKNKLSNEKESIVEAETASPIEESGKKGKRSKKSTTSSEMELATANETTEAINTPLSTDKIKTKALTVAEEPNDLPQSENIVKKKSKSKKVNLDQSANENSEKKNKKSKKTTPVCEMINISEPGVTESPPEIISKKKAEKMHNEKLKHITEEPHNDSLEDTPKKSKKRSAINKEISDEMTKRPRIDEANDEIANKSEVQQQSQKQKSPKKTKKTITAVDTEGKLEDIADKKPKKLKKAKSVANISTSMDTGTCDMTMTPANDEFSISSSKTKLEPVDCHAKPVNVSRTVPSVSKATEIIETEVVCPWTTSNVHLIQGYKYY